MTSMKSVPLVAGRRSLRLNNIPQNGILDCNQVKHCSVTIQRIDDKQLEKVSSKKRVSLEKWRKCPKRCTIPIPDINLDCKQVRPCSVILQRITDEQLRKYSSDSVQSELNQSPEIMDDLNKLNICLQRSVSLVSSCSNSLLLATEAHLDILMAMEMEATYLKIERRHNQCRRPSVNTSNMNPVVRIEKLPPQPQTNNTTNEKSNGHDEIVEKIVKKKVPARQKNPASGGLRRSKRASAIVQERSSSTIDAKRAKCNSFNDGKKNDTPKEILQELRRSKRASVCKKRNTSFIEVKRGRSKSVNNRSNNYVRRNLLQDRNIPGNEENIPEAKRKKTERQINDSDDEDFFGFEPPDKNRRSFCKLKYTLRRLRARTSDKEKMFNLTVTIRVKLAMHTQKHHGRKKHHEERTNEERNINENIKSVLKNNSFEKSPLKSINRIETVKKISCSSSIFQKAENVQPLRGAHGSKFEEGCTNHVLKFESDINDIPVDKLEILKLFKHREEKRHLLDRLIQEQGKLMKSKKSGVKKCLMSESTMDYYSNEYYILKGRKKIPIWCEEKISKFIMISQEQIPPDLISDYFQKPSLTLGSLF